MELFTPEFGLIFWMFVAFAVLFFVLAKWGWPAIMKSVEGRADLIDKGVEYAQNAKGKYAAKISIEQSRKEAELRFRDEVSSFALDIATKVVRKQMADEKAQTQLVNSLLDEIENKN